jgi:hypothetical protein
MAKISAAVGIRSPNRPKDVRAVQRLLNNHLARIGRRVPLDVDGLVGRETISAIVDFQAAVVGMVTPDGIVSPGMKTIGELARKKLHLIQLPAGTKGAYSYVSSKNQFGTRKTIQSIKKVAGLVFDTSAATIGIGHISREEGGKFPPHKSHQRGVEVDIRPVRQDGKRLPIAIESQEYSKKLTRVVVETLVEDGNVERILFNDTNIKDVKFWPGHHDHLHVRFKK